MNNALCIILASKIVKHFNKEPQLLIFTVCNDCWDTFLYKYEQTFKLLLTI